MQCMRFDHQLEQRHMRKVFHNIVDEKQATIKIMHNTLVDQREMTYEMLDEVSEANQTARLMTKRAGDAINISAARQKKIHAATEVKQSLQDEIAIMPKQHFRDVEERECMIADLQDACDENASTIIDLEEQVMDLMDVINVSDCGNL